MRIDVQLTNQPIPEKITSPAAAEHAGAWVEFRGVVRGEENGAAIAALEYEAYPAMARSKMRELCSAAAQRWPVVRTAVVHRLGRLELGDVSVAVAVSCPHRAQAFEAGRYLIDRLKETVPVWKKENWADGTTGTWPGRSARCPCCRSPGRLAGLPKELPRRMRSRPISGRSAQAARDCRLS